MENQETPSMNLRQPLSMVGVLKETMNTILTNKRPMIVILCLLIFTNIQIKVVTRNHLEPLQEDFSFQISNHRGGMKMQQDYTTNFHEQLVTKFHILFCSGFLFFYFAITTISSSYASYTGNTLTIIDVFLKVYRNWKRPLLTSGCILLLTLGINIVYIFSIALISILAGRSSMFSIAPIILKWILNAHVAALSVMSIVVSVLEDGISGIKAIDRAGELMKGKRIQACMALMVCYIIHLLAGKASVAISMMFEEWTMWVIEIPFVMGFRCLLEVLVFVFFTVFYHECKMNHKEDKSS